MKKNIIVKYVVEGLARKNTEDYDGMCWECWDDQLTEESDDMFGDLM